MSYRHKLARSRTPYDTLMVVGLGATVVGSIAAGIFLLHPDGTSEATDTTTPPICIELMPNQWFLTGPTPLPCGPSLDNLDQFPTAPVDENGCTPAASSVNCDPPALVAASTQAEPCVLENGLLVTVWEPGHNTAPGSLNGETAWTFQPCHVLWSPPDRPDNTYPSTTTETTWPDTTSPEPSAPPSSSSTTPSGPTTSVPASTSTSSTTTTTNTSSEPPASSTTSTTSPTSSPPSSTPTSGPATSSPTSSNGGSSVPPPAPTAELPNTGSSQQLGIIAAALFVAGLAAVAAAARRGGAL